MAATIPGAVIGYFLNDLAESAFRHPLLIAVNMSLLGAILLYADSKAKNGKGLMEIGWANALVIGFSQALALLPGVSRSGVTMTAGVFSHLSRQTAARFSFLMAAPITLGACVFKLPDLFENGLSAPIITGVMVSAVVGFLSIKYLLRYLQTHTFRIFVYYRFLFALAVGLLSIFK